MFAKYSRYIISILFFFMHQLAFAVSSPVDLLENISTQVMAALKQQHKQIENNPEVIQNIVDRFVVPHVDIDGMSRSVLGRDIWRKITPEERQEFGREFTRLVTHTYGSALAGYTNEKIRFLSVRGGYEGKKTVQVKSAIVRLNGPEVPVDYRVILMDDGWKVYDIIVDNISLLQSYRSQFSSEISQMGFQNTLHKLAQQNRSQWGKVSGK